MVFHGSALAIVPVIPVLSHWFRCAPGLMYRCLEGAANDEDYPDGPKGQNQENGWILHSFPCHGIFITSLHLQSARRANTTLDFKIFNDSAEGGLTAQYPGWTAQYPDSTS